MKYKDFIRQIDNDTITRAVQEAELHTSAELCVCISRSKTDDPMALAIRLFGKFGLHKTEARNGVIILVVPRSQRTAIYGDEGIHKVAAKGFWDEIIQILDEEIPEDPTRAICDAVVRAGRELSEHFPRLEDDVDELENHPRFD